MTWCFFISYRVLSISWKSSVVIHRINQATLTTYKSHVQCIKLPTSGQISWTLNQAYKSSLTNVHEWWVYNATLNIRTQARPRYHLTCQKLELIMVTFPRAVSIESNTSFHINQGNNIPRAASTRKWNQKGSQKYPTHLFIHTEDTIQSMRLIHLKHNHISLPVWRKKSEKRKQSWTSLKTYR